jgi:hypothetical protein
MISDVHKPIKASEVFRMGSIFCAGQLEAPQQENEDLHPSRIDIQNETRIVAIQRLFSIVMFPHEKGADSRANPT